MVYKLFSWLFFKRKTEEKRNTENLKDCATLSLFLTKHLNSQLPLCGFAHYGVLCPCRRFLPEQRQKTLSGPLGSSPVSATKKNALMGVWWRRVQDCATLSLFLTKHLNSQLPLCGFAHYGVLCPCRRFLPEQRQKTLSGPLGSSPVSATKKNALTGVWWRRVQDSNLCTVIHGDGLAIRCITTLPTLH